MQNERKCYSMIFLHELCGSASLREIIARKDAELQRHKVAKYQSKKWIE